MSNQQSHQLATNPWQSPTSPANSSQLAPAFDCQLSLSDPWCSPQVPQQTATAKPDEFDLFTSNRAVNQSPLTTGNKPLQAASK